MQFPDARILIFAKAPQPGQVNTRLIPLLGETSAAALHAASVRHLVGLRVAAGLAPVRLYVTDTQHPLFCDLAGAHALELCPQVGGDLGERMAQATHQSLAQARQVLLTGTDTPCLGNDRLGQALVLLAKTAAPVLIPALDGGYVLLGLSREGLAGGCDPFSDMPWGTARVAQRTRERCLAAGLPLQELGTGDDLDCPEDLLRLAGPAGLPPGVRDWGEGRWLAWLRQLAC